MIIWDIRITGNCNEKGLGCKAAGYIDTDKKRGMLTALHYNTGGDNIHLPCDEKCDNCNYSHFENDSCTNDDHIFNDNKNDHANVRGGTYIVIVIVFVTYYNIEQGGHISQQR